jgi:DnaK suppressor protein
MVKTLKRTPFDDETLNYFRNLLLRKRSEAKYEIDLLTDRRSDLDEADDADMSSAVHHPADVSSIAEEDDLNYQLLERTKKYVNQINEALERIENGTYGICEATGKPIDKGRLDAVPHTRYSMEAKEKGLDKLPEIS